MNISLNYYQFTISNASALKSLAIYAEGQSLKDCLPREGQFDWVTIDIEGAIIELQLL
jgi:hypothetical protein